MSTKCLIVDDEPLAIKVIQKHLGQLTDVDVVATCNHAVEAFDYLRTHPVDLVFLDIQMPHLTGIDLVKALDHPPRVIFTTAHRDYAVEGFELDVVDYLLKPISFPRLLRAIQKYYTLSGQAVMRQEPPVPEALEERSYLNIKSGRTIEKVRVDDLLFVESMGDYVQLHTTAKTIIGKQRISALEETLAPFNFLRIHRSFLVPLSAITSFTSEEVHLTSGQVLSIGRTYKQQVLSRLKYHDAL